jgi:hypothetical protein
MKGCRSQGIALLAFMAIGGQTAAAEDISGTYVGKGSNSAFLMQIVETKDGQLTGRYEEVVLQPTGKIDDTNAIIAGAVSGPTVVVTIKGAEFLAGDIVASGTIEGRALHLTGGGHGVNLTLNLLKADEADFRTWVAALTRQQAVQRDMKIAADQLAGLRRLSDRMTAFAAKADAMLPKFAPVEQRYRDITRRMRRALAREQSIYGGGQASVARGQISVAINQAAIEGSQLHDSVQSSYQDMANNAGQLDSAAKGASRFCRESHQSNAALPAVVGPDAKNAVCLQYFGAEKSFRQEIMELTAAFAQIEAVWNIEGQAQDKIVKDSDVEVR